MTFVARSCPAYTDIFANKSRNDIMESLQDLGPDSPYTSPASLVDPAVEALAPQSVCKPLPNWEFMLGHGFQSRAVKGPWGSLSKITDPFARAPIVTQSSTPLYDQYHNRIRGRSVAGAVTIELTRAERKQASQADQLWTQGGTPTDPVLARKFSGPQYGFGALRCGTDDVNGDNVEYLFFPAGVKHLCSATPSTSSRRRPPARSPSQNAWSARPPARTQHSRFAGRSPTTPTGSTSPTASPRTSTGPAAKPGR